MKKSLALLACTSVLLLGAGCAPAMAPVVPDVTTTPATTTTTAPIKTTTPPATEIKDTAPITNKSVDIISFAFSPSSITIKAGAKVTWTNSDAMTHSVKADDGSFESGSLAKGAAYSQTFTKAGTYTYHCGIHPTMRGTIIVE